MSGYPAAYPALAPHQAELVALPADRTLFLEGPAGAGKTTASVARLLRLLREGVRADAVLVLTPQRTLATPYLRGLRRSDAPAGGEVTLLTLAGLARRMIELFWPLVAAQAGFAHPDRPPTFLTLETAQYFMARLAGPLLDQGYFDALVMDRNRLYSQILDNLNKAAVVGFPHTEIASRLKAAWVGESSQARVYDEAQECANRFRAYCLENNLLDFSLQYETFVRHLWPLPLCRNYLVQRYTHLIVDNVEEDTPVAHDILAEWLPLCHSALIIYDQDGGYRRFLGADPASAQRLATLCQERITFPTSFVASPAMQRLARRLSRALGMGPKEAQAAEEASSPETGIGPALDFASHRYYPEMLDWVADTIASLVQEQGVSPGEIAVLAPFLSDALRFALRSRLEERGIPVQSHRPSRALREEPATQCLLTLAALCHPQWGITPTAADVTHALTQAIAGLDPVRARLLTEIVYRDGEGPARLSPFDQIEPEMQERITFLLGGRYEGLRTWLAAHCRPVSGERRAEPAGAELDHFLSRLFGELLSQPGYGFHADYDAGNITANLIESVRKFRQVMSRGPSLAGKSLAQEYVEMVRDGLVAAQYMRSWQRAPAAGVLLAPAYTFLMTNRAVDHQFWLDIASTSWWERLHQPLTHPYVLSRHWAPGTPWTDAQEYQARQEALYCVVLGLIRRCRRQIHLGLSELGEQGVEQRGPLARALQQALRELAG